MNKILIKSYNSRESQYAVKLNLRDYLMTIDYNAIATWTALVTALVAIVGLWTQYRQSSFALSVDLIIKLDERFKSEKMIKIRKAAAESILNKTNSNVDDVLEFFELIGLLIRRGALDEKMVWHTFLTWIDGYWHSTNGYITAERKKDPTLWKDFSYLHKRVSDVQNRERGNSDSEIIPLEDSLDDFLKDEANL